MLPVFIDETKDPAAFEPVWQVLKALRAHDRRLADELDSTRRWRSSHGSSMNRFHTVRNDFDQLVHLRRVPDNGPAQPKCERSSQYCRSIGSDMDTDQFQDVRFDIFKQHEPVIRAAAKTNEATTRLRAIDVILFDVLGWDRRSVDPELYCRDTGFADYAFKQGDSLCLILEAKKSDTAFVIANQSYGKRAVGFSLIATQCPDAAKALEQAAGYAFSKGTRYVAITNGHQWLLALTFVQDQPFDQRSVIVFESTDAIISRFSDFFDCFSPAAIYANLPAARLLESRKAPAPEKLARRNPNYPEPANRNAIVDELSVVIDLVWDEMLTEEGTERFLKECYVRPDASGDGIAQAKTVLEQHRRTDELAAQPPANIDRTTSLLKEGQNEEKPIVVLGRIGHGKSTFLHYLRSVEAQTVLQKYIQIDVNFLDRPDRDEEVASFVFAEIEAQLLRRYRIDITEDGFVRGVFDSDLVRFRKSPIGKAFATNEAEYRLKELEHITALQKELHSFYTKIFHHLRCGRGYSVALFFDNLDRRPDSFQEQAFLKASAMARDWDCLVFVCLRHGTYSRSKSDGVLDTIAPKSFVVTAPNTSALLKRRFRFCREMVSADSEVSYGRIVGNNVTLNLPRTARFLECCEESFARNRELVRLFEAVSNGNVRELLMYVKKVLTSRHFNTSKMLDVLEKGDYLIAEHEALRALLYGDYTHYDPSSSPFVNLFDTQRADPMEHFSRVALLEYLARADAGAPYFGFCRTTEVIQYLCQVGFTEDHVHGTIEAVSRRRCCEGKIPDEEWTGIPDSLRLTSLGKYQLFNLLESFQYYDAIVIDTPILDQSIRGKIRDVTRIEERLDRGVEFLGYLLRCCNAIQDGDLVNFLTKTFYAALRDIDEIRPNASGTPRQRGSSR